MTFKEANAFVFLAQNDSLARLREAIGAFEIERNKNICEDCANFPDCHVAPRIDGISKCRFFNKLTEAST